MGRKKQPAAEPRRSPRTGTTKLTPEIQKRLVDALKKGNYRIIACALVGISDRTLREWIFKAEVEGDARYTELAKQVREAEAGIEQIVVARILSAGRREWKADAWYLERRFAQRWGDQSIGVVLRACLTQAREFLHERFGEQAGEEHYMALLAAWAQHLPDGAEAS